MKSNLIRRTMLGEIIDNEVGGLKNNYFNLLSKTWKFVKSKLFSRYGYSIEIKDSMKIKMLNEYLKEIDK